MQGLEILLRHHLHRHKAHGRPAGRIEDRLGIHGIVLGTANERLDEPGMDQAHLTAFWKRRPQ
jgi:hypothetical protein